MGCCCCKSWAFRRQNHEMRLALHDAIADGDELAISCATRTLAKYSSPSVALECQALERITQSETGGISLSYLLSDEFIQLAQDRTGKNNPSFYELKEAFFLGANAIGAQMKCPRDGGLGCSFLDALPRKYRNKCTHFLSWTWACNIRMFRDCLSAWAAKEEQNDIFLYCCFFVENQYREDYSRWHNLECIERRLSNIGKMVAMLDSWSQPVYLTRIWPLFEQVCAVKHDISVTMVLPPDARDALIATLKTGEAGFHKVQKELLHIDAEKARAYKRQDEREVKEHITRTLGFQEVNKIVKRKVIKMIAEVVAEAVRHYFENVCEITEMLTQLEEDECVTKGALEITKPDPLQELSKDLGLK